MPHESGYIYAIKAEGTPYVKIGQTTKAVEHRLKTLQTGQPFALTILAAIKIETGFAGLERQIHHALASHRRHGEWFELSLTAEQFVSLVEDILHPAPLNHVDMPRPRTFGERIHILRRRRGLTQSALAKAIGVSTPTIFRVEKGDFGDVKGQTIARLARTFQVRADYLLGLTDDDSEWTPDADEDDAHAA